MHLYPFLGRHMDSPLSVGSRRTPIYLLKSKGKCLLGLVSRIIRNL